MRGTVLAAALAGAVVLGAAIAIGAGNLAASGYLPVSWNARCLPSGAVCLGMPAAEAMPKMSEREVGGVIDVSCGFSAPGAGAEETNLATVIQNGCRSTRYVASYSDGRHLTNLWVDHGLIVRIDYGSRHDIDL